ncbi:MAG: hypothetical protein ABIK28_10690 [Planctomycetota bacterium]
MDSNAPNERFPYWLPVIAGGLALCIMAGMLVIMFRDRSSPVSPKQVEQRFSEHIAFLKELAFICPAAGLAHLSVFSNEKDKEEALEEIHKAWSTWSKKAESRPDLLSHPAFLGIKIIAFSAEGGTRAAMTIKENKASEPSWFDSLSGCLGPGSIEPEVGQSMTRLCRADDKDVVEYETRFLEPAGMKMGIKLQLDLNHLDLQTPVD